jgi:maleate isomerase
MYGYRARIGNAVAALATEVYLIDFYKLVPGGVSLMVTTLPIGARSAVDVETCLTLSLQAAKTMAECGADLVMLGGVPVELEGIGTVEDMLKRIEDQVGVQVSSSTTAQQKAFKAVGARKIGSVHPFGTDHNRRHETYLREIFGLQPVAIHAGGRDFTTLGKIPIDCALEWGRALKKAHPEIDTLHFASPHWRSIDAIEPLEQELGVSVVTSLQTIAWESLRRTGVGDRIESYGRLLKEF